MASALKAQAPVPPQGGEAAVALPSENPAVRAALVQPRRSASDYVEAILVIAELGEVERARPILAELTQLELTDQQRAEVVRELGSASMLRLARLEELGPEVRAFADACMLAAANIASSPARLGDLIKRLNSPDPDERRAAAIEFSTTGMPGVGAAIQALGTTDSEPTRAGLRQALVALAPLSIAPLYGALDSTNDRLQADAMAILAEISGNELLPFLPGPAFLSPAGSVAGQTARRIWIERAGSLEESTARRLMERAIKNYVAGTPPFLTNEEGTVELWLWNEEAKQVEPVALAPADAALVHATRIARDLAAIAPEDASLSRQALLLTLETGAILGRPVDAESLSSFDTHALSDALEQTLAKNYTAAAREVMDELGERKDPSILFTRDSQPSPLAAALTSSHPQVRFAALRAIMEMKPTSPFPGSSRVAETLTYFSTGSVRGEALIATPVVEEGATLAGWLREAGLRGRPYSNGEQAIEAAGESPNVEIILVDMRINRPSVREVVFQLRRTPATAAVPIGIIAPAGRLTEAERIAAEHTGVAALSRPHDPALVGRYAERLAGLQPRGWPTTEDRVAQAEAALGWIDDILADGPTFYNLRGRPATVQAVLTSQEPPTPQTLASLGKLGTAASQKELIDIASQPVLPIETRQQAAAAFTEAVKANGVLLTTGQIKRQYDRYNASELADAATQEVLGNVLDAIESKKRSGERAVGSVR